MKQINRGLQWLRRQDTRRYTTEVSRFVTTAETIPKRKIASDEGFNSDRRDLVWVTKGKRVGEEDSCIYVRV